MNGRNGAIPHRLLGEMAGADVPCEPFGVFPRPSGMHPRSDRRRLPVGLTSLAILAVGCALSPAGAPSGEPAASGYVPIPEASPSSTTPDPDPEAIPDASSPSAHPAGEPVELVGAIISYDGIQASDGQLVARFSLLSGSAPGTLRIAAPDGETADVHVESGDLVSDPFGSAAEPPRPDAILVLLANQRLVSFVVGPVR